MASKVFLTLYATIFLTKLCTGSDLGLRAGNLEVEFNNSIDDNNIDGINTISNAQLDFTTNVPSSTLNSVGAESEAQSSERILQTRLTATHEAMLNLQQALQPLEEKSDGINAKAKIITRYLNVVNEALEPTNTDKFSKIQVLLHFSDYLDELEHISAGERYMEHIIVKLLMNQYKLYEQKEAVREDLRRLGPEMMTENLI